MTQRQRATTYGIHHEAGAAASAGGVGAGGAGASGVGAGGVGVGGVGGVGAGGVGGGPAERVSLAVVSPFVSLSSD